MPGRIMLLIFPFGKSEFLKSESHEINFYKIKHKKNDGRRRKSDVL